jgi:potassium-dependent mechanosensitive channel
MTISRILLIWFFLMLAAGMAAPGSITAEGTGHLEQADSSPAVRVGFFNDVTGSMRREAAQVSEDIKGQAASLFVHTPLGWDTDTLVYAYRQGVSLPGRAPELVETILEQSRVLGFAGSVVMLIFLVAVAYSLIGRKRVLNKIRKVADPLISRLPEEFQPYIYLALLSVTAALIPLLLLGGFSLVKGFVAYDAPWFLLIGRLLGLWAAGALLISLLRGIFDYGILEIRTDYGSTAVRALRLVILYVITAVAVIWSAETFGHREDFLALLRFLIFLSITVVFLLFFLHKKMVLSLVPQLPFPSYQTFLKNLDRFYYPVVIITFFTGILWCFGFKQFSVVFWTRTWAVVGVYIGFSLLYHLLIKRLDKWAEISGPKDEQALYFIKSLKGVMLYAAVFVTGLVMLDLLGALVPLRRVLSFPILSLGASELSLWIMVKAALILLAFVYASRLICAYLNYKIYPSVGIEPGLGYAIDTFLKYLVLFIAGIAVLQTVGFDLRALMVFAGGVGIGVGLAMKGLAADLISGFSIIFGGKLRKGDWIETGGKLGEVTDIYLRVTKVRTRDNIEYIIPNDKLSTDVIVNYSLSTPDVRVRIPFGVSYDADPVAVARLAEAVAAGEPLLSNYRAPETRFSGYGDNSIDFELLVWVDLRKVTAGKVRSRIYFALFKALKEAGIEIPFPQRDLHLRSGLPEAWQSAK